MGIITYFDFMSIYFQTSLLSESRISRIVRGIASFLLWEGFLTPIIQNRGKHGEYQNRGKPNSQSWKSKNPENPGSDKCQKLYTPGFINSIDLHLLNCYN